MSVDLILTGKYGVLNSQKLLNSTANNINNVNTDGYVRKQTITYTSCVDWGVGETNTRRIYDQYVQRQMFQDAGAKGYYTAYKEGMNTADKVLSDDNMSLANAATSFFDELSTAANLPTSAANRNAAKAKLQTLIERYQNASESMMDSLNDCNSKIADDVSDINSLTRSICNINSEIRSLALTDHATNNEIYMQMLDERDRLIGELSDKVSINVKMQSDNCIAVYMDNGMLLANGDVFAKLEDTPNNYDVTKSDIYLTYDSIIDSGKDKSHVKLDPDSIGGSLGGYMNATREIRNTMRELGKTAVALADALNVQNKAGFTLEDVAGQNLINVKGTFGTASNDGEAVYCTFNEGQGANVQAYSFEVNFRDGDFHLYRIDGDDKRVEITADANVQTALNNAINNGSKDLRLDDYGITLQFNKKIDDLKASKGEFYVQPTFMVAQGLESNVTKPEDFAFASAVRTRTASDNYGNATVSLSRCSNTGANYGVSVGADGKPVFNTGAPSKVVVTADGDYSVYDKDNNLIGKAPASCKGVNIFANAYTLDATGAMTTTKIKDPGYDINVTGTVKDNDTFYVEINSGGQADNSNGTALIQIRSKQITRTTGSEKTTTFNEGYANMLAGLGSEISSATANEAAAQAKLEQTTKLYQSDSGVNLDEEASNLLMYQQTYTSCAKIIEASQTVFNALISAF